MFKNFSFSKISNGLAKTREKITNKLVETFTGRAVVDEDFLEKIEEILISSDIGIATSQKIVDEFRATLVNSKGREVSEMLLILQNIVENILRKNSPKENFISRINNFRPFVILIVGVNGSGKTTTIGKFANILKSEGFKITIGACDTFRAAAVNQLLEWGRRSGVEVFASDKTNDPSSIAFETVQYALKNNSDVVIIDTAGRLHTKNNLMDELSKIKRVISKVLPAAPHETIIVLDGNNGQNALLQAKEFFNAIPLTGLIITKLDGTAKGGAIIQISDQLNIPIYFIGVGEGINDLQEFDARHFSESIIGSYETKVAI